MAVEFFQKRAAQSGFARADFAGELDKSLSLADSVKQMVEGLAMLAAVEKKARVRRDVERRLLQSVVFQIHAGLLAENATQRQPKVFTAKSCKQLWSKPPLPPSCRS